MKAWYEHTRRTVAPAALALAATAAGLLVTAQQAVAQGPNNNPPYIDVGNNMIIDSNLGDYSNALNMIASGYDGGYWDGPGINCIGAADPFAPNGLVAVNVLNTSYFPGITSVFGVALDGNGDQLVIAAGLLGDLNMDGVVDSSDYAMLDEYYTYGLLDGDLAHDGNPGDGSAYALMDECYTYQGLYDPTTLKPFAAAAGASATAGASGSPASVPEPATGSLLVAGAVAALTYRRKTKTA